ncbi:MAG TPA: YceD family protein [Candidatus Acidoferrum sp.]|nr:YceD family protein [Candidatus Acidoferrum sp.]
MPLVVNLRHLEDQDLALRGELPVEELDLAPHDEMIQATRPLRYELEVQLLDRSLLVRGRLRLTLACQCVRCLQPFSLELDLNSWTRHLPLEGEESVAIVNDCADLTAWLREDILLEFPRHPLCRPDCPGLEKMKTDEGQNTGGTDPTKPSAWAELDKLKF